MVPEINIYIDPLIADDVYIRRDAKQKKYSNSF